jgi:hypothetical protein
MDLGRSVVQESLVQFWFTSCEIFGGRNGSAVGFSPSFFAFSLTNYHSTFISFAQLTPPLEV